MESNHRPPDLARIHIWVTGRVQGVGFRAFVQQNAYALGLSGWVRNVGYNQVEIVAEGERHLLERLLEAVRRGPRASRVDETRLEWEQPTGEFWRFEVRRSV
ncbi:MAG: acylphosphatase [Anaerolineae bacterium]|nr:MAG: acylphosphatase [Anaerolineae bacterium]